MIIDAIKLATGPPAVAVSFALLVVFGGLLFNTGPYPQLKSLTELPFPEESLASEEQVREFFEQIGAEGRSLYRGFQALDLLNPILFISFFCLSAALLCQRSRVPFVHQWIILLPLIIAVGELWENIILYIAAGRYPEQLMAMEILPIATAIKFGGLLLSLLLCVGLLIRWRLICRRNSS